MASFANVLCGEVPSLHALTVSPNVLGSHTIPLTATFARYITVPPTGLHVDVMEVASAASEQFIFNYRRPKAELDSLAVDLRDADGGLAAVGPISNATQLLLHPPLSLPNPPPPTHKPPSLNTFPPLTMVPYSNPYIEFSGTVPSLHALRIDPFLLGSRTIPPNATLHREIRISPVDPDMHIHETAAIGEELYIFFYPWNRRDFQYLRREMNESGGDGGVGSYLDLVRAAMANPSGFMNLEGVTPLREDSDMMAYHVNRGYFERANPDKDRWFDQVERNHVGESA
ncbi:hypothetical protein V8C44DRAFT_369979 [Trichoderma aethiopicum]